MSAKKKTANVNVGEQLEAEIKNIVNAIDKFNAIHVEHCPIEAPASAIHKRIHFEVKHLRSAKQATLDYIENNNGNDEQEQ